MTYAITSRARMVNLLAHANALSARALLASPTSAIPLQEFAASETSLATFDPRAIPAVVLTNPLSNDLESMRLTLMSGLLETVQENSKHNTAHLRFFEIGRRYLPSSDAHELPDERRSVGIVLSG